MRARTATVAASLVVAAFALAGCGAAVEAASSKATPITSTTEVREETLGDRAMTAAGKCAHYSHLENIISTGDSGRTVTIKATTGDLRGEGMRPEEAECILKALGATDAAVAHMRTTRQMDGQQTDAWEGVSARWVFSAEGTSAGMRITLTQA